MVNEEMDDPVKVGTGQLSGEKSRLNGPQIELMGAAGGQTEQEQQEQAEQAEELHREMQIAEIQNKLNEISLYESANQYDHFNTTCPELWMRSRSSTMVGQMQWQQQQQPIHMPQLPVHPAVYAEIFKPNSCLLSDEEREEFRKQKRKEDAYKTALCDVYRVTGRCPYGERCRFAHGVAEIRLPQNPRGRFHPKYKTVLCDKFSTTGWCKYGSRCMYIHKVTNPALQQQRLMLTRKLLSEGDNASSTSESESNEKISFASVQANTSVGMRDGARVAVSPQPLHTRSNPTDSAAAYASGHQSGHLPPTPKSTMIKRNLFNQSMYTPSDLERAITRSSTDSPHVDRMARHITSADFLHPTQSNVVRWGSFKAERTNNF